MSCSCGTLHTFISVLTSVTKALIPQFFYSYLLGVPLRSTSFIRKKIIGLCIRLLLQKNEAVSKEEIFEILIFI